MNQEAYERKSEDREKEMKQAFREKQKWVMIRDGERSSFVPNLSEFWLNFLILGSVTDWLTQEIFPWELI